MEKTMEKHIYKAINNIQASLAKSGISKDRKNAQQGYAFRGIDDVYEALAPLLAENGVVVLPHYTERTSTERITAKGGAIFYAVVKGTFELVDSSDGSSTTCELYGEAMDSADKATNKAMSAAYKYMCLQTFCIPTEGDNDADGTTHTVVPQTKKTPKNINDMVADEIPFTEPETPKRAGPDDWLTTNAFSGIAPRTNDISELQRILNEQRSNPRLKELAEIATMRKREIMDEMQISGGVA